MNILWLINIPLPEASQLLNEEVLPFGGWLVNASESLSTKENIKLSVAFPKLGEIDVQQLLGRKIRYFAFPPIKITNAESKRHNEYLEKIIEQVHPDLVHIFGTEFAHSLVMVNICNKKNIKVAISIQGLVSVIASHYTSGIPNKVLSSWTFRDFIKRDNIKQQQKKFKNRGQYETEALQKVGHIIGRTTWDRACTSIINPDAEYFHCNETLRSVFYQQQWTIDKCEKHSIFISQGSYTIKGLHFVIEAMPYLLKRYPNAKLYVAGDDITKSNTIKEKLKISSYGKYIKKLIIQEKLEKSVIFTGVLDEKQMCDRYLKANVFVSPSAIENSSNSLSEAKLLGLPCVASYVGGVTDLLNDKQDGFFYQLDAPYMLAYYVSELFSDENLALKFSKNARAQAIKIHDPNENTKRLINIYREIIRKGMNVVNGGNFEERIKHEQKKVSIY